MILSSLTSGSKRRSDEAALSTDESLPRKLSSTSLRSSASDDVLLAMRSSTMSESQSQPRRSLRSVISQRERNRKIANATLGMHRALVALGTLTPAESHRRIVLNAAIATLEEEMRRRKRDQSREARKGKAKKDKRKKKRKAEKSRKGRDKDEIDAERATNPAPSKGGKMPKIVTSPSSDASSSPTSSSSDASDSERSGARPPTAAVAETTREQGVPRAATSLQPAEAHSRPDNGLPFTRIIEGLSAPICVSDMSGALLLCNAAMRAACGGSSSLTSVIDSLDDATISSLAVDTAVSVPAKPATGFKTATLRLLKPQSADIRLVISLL